MATTDFRITRLSKVIAVLLFALWAVSFIVPETVSYLALVPGRWEALGGQQLEAFHLDPTRHKKQRVAAVAAAAGLCHVSGTSLQRDL